MLFRYMSPSRTASSDGNAPVNQTATNGRPIQREGARSLTRLPGAGAVGAMHGYD